MLGSASGSGAQSMLSHRRRRRCRNGSVPRRSRRALRLFHAGLLLRALCSPGAPY